MEDLLDITAVAAATGLTLRALRFYEARGLVSPLRTAGGRRVYGRGELARLNAAVALKRAGFSLAQIGKLLGGRTVDLGRLVALQLDALDAQAAQLQAARTLLSSVQSRIDRGEPIDVATLCSLIRSGENVMEQEKWQKVSDTYLSDEAKADSPERHPSCRPISIRRPIRRNGRTWRRGSRRRCRWIRSRNRRKHSTPSGSRCWHRSRPSPPRQ